MNQQHLAIAVRYLDATATADGLYSFCFEPTGHNCVASAEVLADLGGRIAAEPMAYHDEAWGLDNAVVPASVLL